MSEKTIIMKISSQADLSGTVILNDGTKSSNVAWTSSDNTVAVVNNGKVTANKIGSTTILAVSNVDSSYKGILNIDVVDSANFSSIDSKSINNVKNVESYISNIEGKKNNIKLKLNTNVLALSVVTLNDDTKNSNVIWESSDENIATVDYNGKILAKKIGVTTIVSKYKLNPDFKSLIVIEVVESLGVDSNLTNLPNIVYSPNITPSTISLPSIIPTSNTVSSTNIIPISLPKGMSSPDVYLPAKLVISKTEFSELNGNLDNFPNRGEVIAVIPTFTNIGGVSTNELKVKISTDSLYATAENILYSQLTKSLSTINGIYSYKPKIIEYGMILDKIIPNSESSITHNTNNYEKPSMILTISKTVLPNTKVPVIYYIVDDFGNSWTINDETLIR